MSTITPTAFTDVTITLQNTLQNALCFNTGATQNSHVEGFLCKPVLRLLHKPSSFTRSFKADHYSLPLIIEHGALDQQAMYQISCECYTQLHTCASIVSPSLTHQVTDLRAWTMKLFARLGFFPPLVLKVTENMSAREILALLTKKGHSTSNI